MAGKKRKEIPMKVPPDIILQDKSKYNQFSAEKVAVRNYLSKHNATATMVAVALDIYRPNLCRYKSMLQEEGVLVVTHHGICHETGFPADYLSCDPELIKKAKEGSNGSR